MKIEKVDGSCLKGNADYKREHAKQTISQCLEKVKIVRRVIIW